MLADRRARRECFPCFGQLTRQHHSGIPNVFTNSGGLTIKISVGFASMVALKRITAAFDFAGVLIAETVGWVRQRMPS